MDLKKLKYFLEITETLNLSKAAENLHMSQPPLTYQLKMLEESLGVKLFNRTTRTFEITPAGEKLKERALQILELVEATREELKDFETENKTIRIGFVASSSALLSPNRLIDFHNKYHDITFVMKEGNTHKIIELLNHGLIDIGLVRTPFNAEAYNVEYLESEPMIAVYDTNVYEFEENLSLKKLRKMPLVLDKRFSSLITGACHSEGFTPNIICEGEDSRSILAWTEAGLGIAVLPYSGKYFIKDKKLSYRRINAKSLETRGAIITLKNKKEPPYIRDLITLIEEKK